MEDFARACGRGISGTRAVTWVRNRLENAGRDCARGAVLRGDSKVEGDRRSDPIRRTASLFRRQLSDPGWKGAFQGGSGARSARGPKSKVQSPKSGKRWFQRICGFDEAREAVQFPGLCGGRP